ncbi:hypothetical protein HanPSC8_Chr05g0192911 [Helianthus annuus]|nr:hypothetical protein HanPSC8_Chr05g0192911 [Helianthus annuus]
MSFIHKCVSYQSNLLQASSNSQLQQIAVMDKFSLYSEGREGKNPKFRSSLFTLAERTTI